MLTAWQRATTLRPGIRVIAWTTVFVAMAGTSLGAAANEKGGSERWGAYETPEHRLLILAHWPGTSDTTALYDSRSGQFTPLTPTSSDLCTDSCAQRVQFIQATSKLDAIELSGEGRSAVAQRLPLIDAEHSFNFEHIVHEGRVWRPNDSQRHPAVVLLGGTGNDLRDDFRIYPYLLAKAGYVAYAFDKQGTDNPAPDEESIVALAQLAHAAVEAVRELPDVDPERVGILGISHGAWVAIEAARDDPRIAFAIPIVGGGVPLWEATAFETHNKLVDHGYRSDDVREGDEFLSKLFGMLRDGRAADIPAFIARYADRPWFKATPVAPFAALPAAMIQQIAAARWDDELSYDPSSALKQLRIPMFAVAAERDRMVSGAQNLQGLARASGGRVTTLLLRNANHHQALEDRAEFVYAPELKANLERWLAQNLQPPKRTSYVRH